MQVSMMIEGQEGVTWAQWVALAKATEATALDGLFRSDHYTNFHGKTGGALDAWTTIAGLAAITSRIRLGTLVSPVTFRSPGLMARIAVSADHISGGRVTVGLGAGWNEQEHSQNGFPFPPLKDRFDMLSEQVEIVTKSWTGEAFSFDGQHYSAKDQLALPRPVQQPHPPIILGGAGKPKSLALAAKYAQEYNTIYSTPEAAATLRSALDKACEKIGRDPSTLPLSGMGFAGIGKDETDAQARLERMVARMDSSAQNKKMQERLLAMTPKGDVAALAEHFAPFAQAGMSKLYIQNFEFEDASCEVVGLLGELAEALG